MKRSHFKLTGWVQPPVWERISQQFTLFCLSYFPYFIFTVTLITPVHNILLNPWSELGNTFKIMSETALKCFVIFVHFHWKNPAWIKKWVDFFFSLNNSLTLEKHQAIKNQLQAWCFTPSLTPTKTKHKNEPKKVRKRMWTSLFITTHHKWSQLQISTTIFYFTTATRVWNYWEQPDSLIMQKYKGIAKISSSIQPEYYKSWGFICRQQQTWQRVQKYILFLLC